MFLVINYVVFQIAWLSAVIGGAQQMPLLGPLTVMIALLIHVKAARRPFEEVLLVLCCGLIGTAFDSFIVAMGWVSYTSGLFSNVVAPYWIITMWMLFATTLNVSLRFLRGKPAMAALFGLLGGPTTYLAGEKLGGIQLTSPVEAMIALGVGWAIMMPALMRLSEKLNGMSNSPSLRNRWAVEQQEW